MGPSWEPLSPTLFLGHREPCLQPEGAGVRLQQQQGQEPRREGAQKADPRPRCSEDRSTPALTAPTLAIGETLIVGSPCACQFLEGRNCSVRFCSFRRTSAHCLEGVRNVFDENMNKGLLLTDVCAGFCLLGPRCPRSALSLDSTGRDHVSSGAGGLFWVKGRPYSWGSVFFRPNNTVHLIASLKTRQVIFKNSLFFKTIKAKLYPEINSLHSSVLQ